MGTYVIKDSNTGMTMTVQGDSAPTAQEAEELFASHSGTFNSAQQTVDKLLQPRNLPDHALVKDEYSADPTNGMSGMGKFLAGAGKGMTDIGRAAAQIAGADNQGDIDASRRLDTPLMQTGAGKMGNIAGASAIMAPLAMIPGANTYAGAALLGATSGALTPTSGKEDRLMNALKGAGFGMAGKGGVDLIGSMLAPKIAPEVTQLMDEGVTPTPGQIMGGTLKKMESASESIPFVGEGIRQAKGRAMEDFNKAAINRALSPIGETVDAIGHEGIKQADELIGQAYDKAYKMVPAVEVDDSFLQGMDKIKQIGNDLTPDRATQLGKLIDDRVLSKVPDSGALSGQTWGDISSQLKTLARQKLSDPDSDARAVGQALNQAAGEIRDLIGRHSPEADDILSKADAAYAGLVRVQGAASKNAAGEGVFSPNQLGSAIRAADTSVRKRAISRGEGLMQDFAQTSQSVLGGELPNSGTADRTLNAVFLGGLGLTNPKALAAALMARGAYTEPAQKAIAAFMTQRTPEMISLGELLKSRAPYGAIIGANAAK